MSAEPVAAARPPEARAVPFLKWAGGKRQLLPEILPRIGEVRGRYYEPFLGGGAVLLALQPERAVLADLSPEVLNCWQAVRDHPEELIRAAARHANTAEAFYAVRALDRAPGFEHTGAVERAARILYLNHTCYNGLFRTNRRGEFNAPFGRYANPAIVRPAELRAVSGYLRAADVEFRQGDFAAAVADAGPGDFAYFDPPYHPVTRTASFTAYSAGGFGAAEQERLRDTCDRLRAAGARVLVSNSDTPYVRALYRGGAYVLHEVSARRAINSDAAGRGAARELLIAGGAT